MICSEPDTGLYNLCNLIEARYWGDAGPLGEDKKKEKKREKRKRKRGIKEKKEKRKQGQVGQRCVLCE